VQEKSGNNKGGRAGPKTNSLQLEANFDESPCGEITCRILLMLAQLVATAQNWLPKKNSILCPIDYPLFRVAPTKCVADRVKLWK
jgi:hypothetical protein